MNLIDSHTHLFLHHFENDIDQVINNAIDKGVEAFMLPNIDSSTIESMNQLTDKYPDYCFPMIGLHPCSVKENYKKELQLVEEWVTKRKFYAIGEIGIDLYWDKTYLQEQQTAFEQQIVLAKKHQLPIVIHARESFNEIFEVLDQLNDDQLTGVFPLLFWNSRTSKKMP